MQCLREQSANRTVLVELNCCNSLIPIFTCSLHMEFMTCDGSFEIRSYRVYWFRSGTLSSSSFVRRYCTIPHVWKLHNDCTLSLIVVWLNRRTIRHCRNRILSQPRSVTRFIKLAHFNWRTVSYKYLRLCQNKPPCLTASWKLTSVTCPILYPFAISKPVQRSSNLQ